jgi:cyclophilin family peptidyl-prolyl cis-trans isomerase
LTIILLTLARVGWVATSAPSTTQAARPGASAGLEAVQALIATDHPFVNTGEPVWIDFLLYNTSDQPATLTVPKAEKSAPKEIPMGLPLDHVFSGEKFRALSVIDGQGKECGKEVMLRPIDKTIPITLAPKGVVGTRLEMGQYYTALRRSGLYVLEWQPYGGAIKSNTLRLEIRPLKEVVMITNFGPIRLSMLYDKAPNHVANFLELVETGFYNRLKFFRLFPGIAIMGGCPNNDGSGMRKDSRTLKAEFNDTPFDEGTVGMSLAGDDPNSASCQFFICLRRVKQWDGKYTAFAKVIGPESFETLRKIGQVAVDAHDRPANDIIIERMNVETVHRGSQNTLIQATP